MQYPNASIKADLLRQNNTLSREGRKHYGEKERPQGAVQYPWFS